MANSVSFDAGIVMECCQNMNKHRKLIMQELNMIKGNYNSVLLTQWNGATRKHFHEEVFGFDGISGLIGGMDNKKTLPYGMCYALNNLLYTLAEYVCDVKNRDGEYLKQYSPLRPEFFVDNTISVNTINVIDYKSISVDNVIISPEIMNTLKIEWKKRMQTILGNVNSFNKYLSKCISEGIEDDTTTALQLVANNLSKKAERFSRELDQLFMHNENVAAQAAAASKIASSENQKVASILSNVNFD